MKKLFFTAVTLFIVGFSTAQVREKGTFELTPQIGYSNSNYYGKNVNNNNPVNGLAVGVGVDYFFNSRWSIRSGLHNQIMGSQGNSFVDKLDYLTLPLNANWHFGSTRKWNLNFGPCVGVLLSATENGRDIKDLAYGSQLSLNVGIGYKIEVSNKFSILFDYQSYPGLSDITKSPYSDLRNSYGVFNLGAVCKL